ncbi:MAG: tetratricopeptide repeat protein [Rubricoccaceae bacterium]|nr:tetratricopeptide repeat protein [Rubricoccaceae bacterium]
MSEPRPTAPAEPDEPAFAVVADADAPIDLSALDGLEGAARLDALLDLLTPYVTRAPEQQLALGEEALALAERHGDTRARARALSLVGRGHLLLSEYDRALPHLTEAMVLLEREGDPEARRAKGMLASLHHTIGNYEEAMRLALDNLEDARREGEPEEVGWHLHGLSGAYFELGDTERALDYAMQALDRFTALGHPVGQARSHSSVGTVLSAQGRHDEAQGHHEVSLQLFQQAGDRLGESRALYDLGRAAHARGDIERALEVQQEALALRRHLNHPQSQSTSLLALGEALLAAGRTDEALATLHEALDIAEALRLRPRLFQVHRALSDAYDAAGDPERALHHYRRYHDVRGSVLDAQTAGRLQTMQVRHDVERARQEAEIERLRGVELREKNEQLQRLLDELRRAQDRLVQSEKLASLGRVTSGIAHELKNPLNFVVNFAGLNAEIADDLRAAVRARRDDLPDDLAAELDDGLATFADNVARVLANARRADGILRSMLGHVRATEGERRRVSLHALLDQAIANVFGEHEGDPATIVERTYDREVGEVEAAPGSLGRVFFNLLENARYAVCCYADASGGDYRPRIEVRTRALPGLVQVRVVDNGPGVPEDHCTRLFEPFFTTKPPGEGTGLGLSLASDIVTQGHGGSLAVHSREGEGATFVVTLPVEEAPGEAQGEG